MFSMGPAELSILVRVSSSNPCVFHLHVFHHKKSIWDWIRLHRRAPSTHIFQPMNTNRKLFFSHGLSHSRCIDLLLSDLRLVNGRSIQGSASQYPIIKTIILHDIIRSSWNFSSIINHFCHIHTFKPINYSKTRICQLKQLIVNCRNTRKLNEYP